MHKICWIIVLSFLSVVSAAARYTDCEVAPPVQYATQNVEDDDYTVTVIYTCERGYELRGESKLVCDLDTDEWLGDPPLCERVEQVTSEHATDTNGNKDGSTSQEETGSASSTSTTGKKKGIQEADRITSEFAKQLDMSCYNPPKVAAPQIKNGHIVTYDRRQKKGHIFLVAIYNCSVKYEMEDVTNSILYCSKKSWIGERPVCIAITDEYGDDYEEGEDEGGDEDEEEEIDEEERRRHQESRTEVNRIDNRYDESGSEVREENENNEIDREQVLNRKPIEEITEETPRVFNETCGADRGGCDHECRMVMYPEESEPRIICSCYSGFTLDIYDMRRCNDIDECSQNNGGCEQICTNVPGSFQCTCNSGLQIDTVTGNTCIDINECLLRNGHGPCQDTCHNLWSTYMCTCENLPGTRISKYNNHTCEDNDECAKNNGGCTHKCLTIVGRIFCLCPDGFYLTDDWKTCKDIDECSKSDILSLCPYGCENTHGSYRCLEPPPTRTDEIEEEIDEENHRKQQPNENDRREENEIENNIVVEPKIEQNCRDGYQLNNQNECIDIDECAEGRTGCEYCQNVNGGFECYCPDGYELSDNEKTCQDINECEVYSDYADGDDENNDEQARSNSGNTVCSHECVNLIGSYQCKCPHDFHLHTDKRTCVKDYCQDLVNPELNKIKCSYNCIDETEGFKCECPQEHTLDSDLKTCISSASTVIDTSDDECIKYDGQSSCYPGTCVSGGEYGFSCVCPSGYLPKERRCHDIDECSTGIHKCSHDCINNQGSYECNCPPGLRLSDANDCQDINECIDEPNVCGNDLICENTYGSYKCICPEGKEFQSDGKCAVHFNACAIDNGNCSHKCTSHNSYAICDCPEGMVLTEDDHTCIENNPCYQDNGGCTQNCNPNSQIAENRCYCNQGYELMSDQRTCMDYDECKENNGGCNQICINLPGSYKCLCKNGFEMLNNNLCKDIDECLLELHNCSMNSICVNIPGEFKCDCPDGFAFNKTLNQCLDIDECLLYNNNNGNCSHICINLPGSFQCSCPIGQVLINDEKTCQIIDECQLNNGGCSHDCHYSLGIVTCLCPNGYSLDNSSKNCIDIDECSIRNGRCTHKCENYLGDYKCLCPYGYALNNDGFTCSDIDECIENNGNCSNICINLLGSYSCTCEVGFELERDLHTCIDVNECIQNLHDCSHLCVNIPGSYECTCPAGYEIAKESKFICEDINECEITTNGGCSHRCINTLGAYNCDCPTGHSLSEDNRTCAILNECNVGERKCSHNCENRIGGYQCFCPGGMTLAEDESTCIDVNECNEENAGCSHICQNNEGSYSCSCPEGYNLGDDSRTCFDIDECLEYNGGCNQYCVNFGGGFKCECAPNYVLANDGRTCQSDNYCNHDNGGCQQICESTSTGPRCSCRPGFILDSPNNTTCTDIDECRYSNTCQQECRNTIGSFECRCHSGYTKDALGQCIDVNECEFLNGGCSTNSECINLPGSFKCTCHDGYKLTVDKKTCFEIKDYCMPLKPPRNGEIHCTRSRHKTQLYYKTKCSVWCHKGFRLEGPSTRHCNGTGEWDEYENQCIPQTCPPLPKPEHGTILPASCLLGNIFAGERCLLHCPSGFIPSGKRAAICNVDQTWSTNSTLECVSIPLSVPTMPSSFPIASAIPASVATSRTTSGTIKPYIKCPQDTILILPSGQKTVFIRLEQPKTNVDYFKLVDSHPDWAKNLDAHLGAGVHIITFRARSPNSNLNAICKTVITVKEAHPPTIVYCPPSYDIQLGMNERARSLSWKEPVFQSHGHLKQIYKSKVPGEMFGPGVHNILYVATDRDGQSSRCEFKLIVRGTQHHQISSPQQNNHNNRMEGSRLAGYKVNGLENHESYLLCPGKESIKIETNYPVHVPVGCFIKNIRLHGMRHHHKRRHHKIPKSELNKNSVPYKITIIGLDEIGSSCAAVFMRDYRIPIHLCLIDKDKDKAKCIMSDLDHCSGYFPSISVSSSSDLTASKDSNIIIICFESLPYKDEIDNTIDHNLELFQSVIPEICKFSPNAILLNCTSPFNILTHIIWKLSNFPKSRVLGLGSCIETILFHFALAKRFNVPPSVCKGWIIGTGSGENKIAVWSSVSVGGSNLNKFMPQTGYGSIDQSKFINEINDIHNESLMVTGIVIPPLTLSAAIHSICDAIINDTKKVFPMSILARGVHGINQEIYIALPCVIGGNGVYAIVEQNLSRHELNLLRRTAIRLKETFNKNNNKLSLVYKSIVMDEMIEFNKKNKKE